MNGFSLNYCRESNKITVLDAWADGGLESIGQLRKTLNGYQPFAGCSRVALATASLRSTFLKTTREQLKLKSYLWFGNGQNTLWARQNIDNHVIISNF